jgi:hypothetical protein
LRRLRRLQGRLAVSRFECRERPARPITESGPIDDPDG